MTKLLVSVRNVWEVAEALAGGAQIVDVKEPRWGSLGAATDEDRQAIQLAVQSAQEAVASELRIFLSAALGELRDYASSPATRWLTGYDFAKIGLAGCAGDPDWSGTWERWQATLPETTAPVAVVYADYRSAAAPSPSEVLEAAAKTDVRTLLIDTCDKRTGGTLACLAAGELADILEHARDMGMRIALAGSITLEQLPEALRWQPDWIAVRGGVCRGGGRESMLDRELVKRFVMQLSTPIAGNVGVLPRPMIDSLVEGA